MSESKNGRASEGCSCTDCRLRRLLAENGALREDNAALIRQRDDAMGFLQQALRPSRPTAVGRPKSVRVDHDGTSFSFVRPEQVTLTY